jgi:anti-anti-sigma regulatory factor
MNLPGAASMPFAIQTTEEGLLLELTGGVTVRHAQELGKCLTSSLSSGTRITVRTRDLEDIDTSILQLLVSLRKTSAAFALEDVSEAFVNAVDRCALRRELLAESKEFS